MAKKDKPHIKKFGAALREERTAARLTQEELAKMADITTKYLSRIELGDQMPSVDIAARLAVALGVSLDALLGLPLRTLPPEIHLRLQLDSQESQRRFKQVLRQLLG